MMNLGFGCPILLVLFRTASMSVYAPKMLLIVKPIVQPLKDKLLVIVFDHPFYNKMNTILSAVSSVHYWIYLSLMSLLSIDEQSGQGFLLVTALQNR